VSADRKSGLARERLRRRYRPARVRLLFVGEAPPASGRFFYQADSGLYRAIRDTFASVFPDIGTQSGDEEFLRRLQALGCYLVDLCGRPVDRLPRNHRTRACRDGEVRLARILNRLRPETVITVVRSITGNVRRSQQRANWLGARVELPYPGRWQRHRMAFIRQLAPALRKIYRRRQTKPASVQRKVA
jgi:hypothetical protein